jgi:ABC-type multidrug transport system ATPase subunit
MPIVLRAHTLWKSYAAGVMGCSARVWVLRGASLHLHEGECLAVLGARGAGTTTLLHCLAGLRRPDAGCVESEMPALLLETRHVVNEPLPGRRVLLVDDGFDPRRRSARPPIARGCAANARATIIATHELSRVRGVADRILLLHHGGLLPLDHPTEARFVAERFQSSVTDSRGPDPTH